MVEPARPAAGSPSPAGLMSAPLDDDRGIIPKSAANTIRVWVALPSSGSCTTDAVQPLFRHDLMQKLIKLYKLRPTLITGIQLPHHGNHIFGLL